MARDVLDVRPRRKHDKYPTIFAAHNALDPGESSSWVNNHDPIHLRDEVETQHPRSHDGRGSPFGD
jgi:uncharacterized protein (DUF2249 family)